MRKVRSPDPALAWFDEGTDDFNDYMDAVNWAQAYAKINREIMMEDVMAAVREVMPGAEISPTSPSSTAITTTWLARRITGATYG